MQKGRLEAFSDGVIAIIITIMVLEMKVPHGNTLDTLKPLLPVFLSYVLSFINVGIYWNNHHHLLHATNRINGMVLWANIHFLFWLSLIPFTSGWMGTNNFSTFPVCIYGVVLFMAGVAYYLLEVSLIKVHGMESTIHKAIGKDIKGIISVSLYAIAIGLSFVSTKISMLLYAAVAIIWFIPDRRIEMKMDSEK